MMFILFLDAVGAEFTQARATRKDVVAATRAGLLRFKPTEITPIEVIGEKGGARRAAGGFILLGPLGAALGVLTSKGSQVLFELAQENGSKRRGVIAQRDYARLCLKVERMQTYQPGDFSSSIVKRIGQYIHDKA